MEPEKHPALFVELLFWTRMQHWPLVDNGYKPPKQLGKTHIDLKQVKSKRRRVVGGKAKDDKKDKGKRKGKRKERETEAGAEDEDEVVVPVPRSRRRRGVDNDEEDKGEGKGEAVGRRGRRRRVMAKSNKEDGAEAEDPVNAEIDKLSKSRRRRVVQNDDEDEAEEEGPSGEADVEAGDLMDAEQLIDVLSKSRRRRRVVESDDEDEA
eukprot:CAMPEP_0175931758 /NCGR_PEP_ID=MMETSP0108-20121206/19021_1 /TAXON_ID=195067 ORGANISM="Goniomonas pacifica, Strain CCMP1869" /NCGR_SAMPLE_ID=MMETSP0108 /ASSEMBLY_ACC=CAM_ASM_000204 /LENGTH=207 /DNA_ID=CAMNT_0017255339 /DNA_START=97 /DNA_END=717 /DNA_ORIENTATION=+